MIPATAHPDEELQMEMLANEIAGICQGRHSNVVLGALLSLATKIIELSPHKGYAIACADFMETKGREIKAGLTT